MTIFTACIFCFWNTLDGGVARLRVYGIAVKDWSQISYKPEVSYRKSANTLMFHFLCLHCLY